MNQECGFLWIQNTSSISVAELLRIVWFVIGWSSHLKQSNWAEVCFTSSSRRHPHDVDEFQLWSSQRCVLACLTILQGFPQFTWSPLITFIHATLLQHVCPPLSVWSQLRGGKVWNNSEVCKMIPCSKIRWSRNCGLVSSVIKASLYAYFQISSIVWFALGCEVSAFSIAISSILSKLCICQISGSQRVTPSTDHGRQVAEGPDARREMTLDQYFTPSNPSHTIPRQTTGWSRQECICG